MKLLSLCCLVVFSQLSLTSVQAEDAPSGGAVAGATDIKHANAKDAKAMLDANAKDVAEGKATKITVLDVRSAAEYSDGHIADSKNINFTGADFEKEVSQLDKTKPYLVHCAAGGRSTKSLEIFKKLGFKSIIHLDGGLNAWTKEGNPVVK